MSTSALVEKIESLPVAERAQVESLVDSLSVQLKVAEGTSPRAHFDRVRAILQAAHGKLDISSSIRELRDSDH